MSKLFGKIEIASSQHFSYLCVSASALSFSKKSANFYQFFPVHKVPNGYVNFFLAFMPKLFGKMGMASSQHFSYLYASACALLFSRKISKFLSISLYFNYKMDALIFSLLSCQNCLEKWGWLYHNSYNYKIAKANLVIVKNNKLWEHVSLYVMKLIYVLFHFLSFGGKLFYLKAHYSNFLCLQSIRNDIQLEEHLSWFY
jgi:hypothetical protein